MKNILVIGAARSGVAVAKVLLERDHSVILTDTRDVEAITKEFPQVKDDLEKLMASGRLKTVFGQQISVDVLNEVDEVVTSPGVPPTIPVIDAAYHQGIPVLGEVEAAFRLTKTPFIAITGTNGKTTTTTLTGQIFKAATSVYDHAYTVGNIGDPITRYIDVSTEKDVYVTEISSYQLMTIDKFHPVAAAILNLSPDHLDRHKTLENYYAAKARVFENQTDKDLLVLNADDADVCRISADASSRKVYFSSEQELENGAFVKDGKIFVAEDGKKQPVCAVDEVGIKGPHNVMNALAATALSFFKGVDTATIKAVLMRFKGVEHRQEFVGTVDGVDYINDSKGTNTNASITALKAMTKPVVLIAGGYNKNENYAEFMGFVKEKAKHMLLIGDTAKDIAQEAESQGFTDFSFVTDYPEAVARARELAAAGDVVLLSPACASWDMFDNYEDRGDLFKELVMSGR